MPSCLKEKSVPQEISQDGRATTLIHRKQSDVVVIVQSTDSELSLAGLISLIREKFILISLTILSCAALGFFAPMAITPWYMASAQIIFQDPSSTEANLEIGNVPFLPSLVDSNPVHQYLARAVSRSVVTEAIEKQGLLPLIFPEEYSKMNTENLPSVSDGYDRLAKTMTWEYEGSSKLVRLDIKSKEPKAAALLASKIVAAVNSRIREETLSDLKNQYDLVYEILERSGNTVERQALTGMAAHLLRQIVTVRANDAFPFKVVDPAIEPKYHYWPNRIIMTGSGILLGIIISLLLVFGSVNRARK